MNQRTMQTHTFHVFCSEDATRKKSIANSLLESLDSLRSPNRPNRYLFFNLKLNKKECFVNDPLHFVKMKNRIENSHTILSLIQRYLTNKLSFSASAFDRKFNLKDVTKQIIATNKKNDNMRFADAVFLPTPF